jgi:serine/threonine-protein kinase
MPYIRGETLRSRLEREGPFPVSLCLRVLRDTGEALLHAHRHGVVHRDIKPENIFIAGGHAVVTDFGIARGAAHQLGPRRTSPGLVLGTPAYMAPEQATGEADADHRVDLYALGVVAYEVLTGVLPFKGTTTREFIASHVTTRPVPLETLRPDLPIEMVEAVTKCIAKDPSDRWESADDLLRLLEAIRPSDSYQIITTTTATRVAAPVGPARSHRWVLGLGGAVLVGLVIALFWRPRPPIPERNTGRSTVAVLKPQVEPGTPALTRFGERLQRAITHELQRSRAPVLDRLAIDDFAAATDRVESARRRGIGLLVVTTLRPSDRGVEVDLSLVNAISGVQLRSSELGPADTAAFDALASHMADSLRSWLRLQVPGRKEATNRPPQVSALLDQAEREIRTRTATGTIKAISLYQQVIAQTPDDAEAHARLSNAYSLLLVYFYRGPATMREIASLALAHAERSIQLDAASDEAYTARAYILNQINAPTAAVRADFDRARDLNPSSEPGWYSVLLMREGRRDEAMAEAWRGVSLDPRAPGRWLALAWDAMGFRDYELALAAADSALQLDPDLSLARGVLARARLLSGREADCANMEAWPYLGTKGACLAAVGRTAEAATLVDSLVHLFSSSEATFDISLFAQELAAYFSFSGERDAARVWIRELYHRTPIGLPIPFQRSDLFARTLAERGFSRELTQLVESANLRVRQDGQRLLLELVNGR